MFLGQKYVEQWSILNNCLYLCQQIKDHQNEKIVSSMLTQLQRYVCTEDEAKEADLRQNKGCQVSPFTGYEL